MTSIQSRQLVLRVSCADKKGVLAKVTSALAENDCDIREAAVFGDSESGKFFIRLRAASERYDREAMEEILHPLAERLELDMNLFDLRRKTRVVAAVSKFDHCLADLLHKEQIGALPVDIVAVVSNHPDLEKLARWYGKPYYFLPVSKDTKTEQEDAISELVEEHSADILVLARYMQILSDRMARRFSNRCINIHHSFLPSFKGAKPYHQAHERGVKLIGATAHYVTEDLDEGPIIEQDVRRVTHATSAEAMVEIGREVEASVLSRALKWHAEHRVFLTGGRTIVL